MARFLISLGSGLLFAVATGGAVSAQSPPPSAPKAVIPPPAIQQRCTQPSIDPSKPETRGQGGSHLGEQLSQSNGVICPPKNLDPEIAAPPPGGGKTPVIPPPGTPGGNPDIVPK